MILGFVATSFYRRYRDGHPDGYFLHMAYYYLGYPLKGRSFVNPFIKEFLP
jgi:conjugal transfer pilus assembly protein TraL